MFCCFVAGALSIATLSGCGSKDTARYSQTGTYFDTVITITLYDKDQASLIDDCFEMADRYEQLFSRTIDTSDVSRINDADGEFVTVDAETIELIEYGLYYCELSEGKFDITIGALSDLWDIKNNPGVIPDDADIQAALDTVGYQNLVIDGDKVALTKSGAKLDLGGIAKGFIADKMKAYLMKQGVTSGIISLGGNVLVIGNKPDDSMYTVAVQKPFDEMNSAIAALSVSDKTVVSSGIYERYFELDGKIYHHIIDTTTGYPIENNLFGVTIICDKSVDGDGLSTTCFSLGLEDGMKLIESLDDTEAIFITDDYELHCSSGIGTDIPMTEQ
jgi:thiamine biosynthesis lipoprotein